MLNNRRAFTLIELIMVIAIIGILAVIITVSTPSTIKLRGAANKLMFDLRYAQQLAISRQTSCGVSFDPSGDSYFAYIGDISTIATDPQTRGNLSIDYDTDSDYDGVSLVSTNFGDQISFDYMGIPYDSTDTALSSQGVITLRYESTTQTVTVEVGTGQVKVP